MKILMTSTLALGAVCILAINQPAAAENSDASNVQLIRGGGGHVHGGGGGAHMGGAHMGGGHMGSAHHGGWDHGHHHDGHHHDGRWDGWGYGAAGVGVGVGLGALGTEIIEGDGGSYGDGGYYYEDGSNCAYDAARGYSVCRDEYGRQYYE